MIKFRAFSLAIYEPFHGIPYRQIASQICLYKIEYVVDRREYRASADFVNYFYLKMN